MSEAERWLAQARRDLDDARYDQYYIPTRYPNGLPGGIPADAYRQADAERGLARASAVLDLESQKSTFTPP